MSRRPSDICSVQHYSCRRLSTWPTMVEWCRLTQRGYEKAHSTGRFGSVFLTFRKTVCSPPQVHVLLMLPCLLRRYLRPCNCCRVGEGREPWVGNGYSLITQQRVRERVGLDRELKRTGVLEGNTYTRNLQEPTHSKLNGSAIPTTASCPSVPSASLPGYPPTESTHLNGYQSL